MRKARVAAIEDESNILDLISYNLSREGYELVTSNNGLEGLELIKTKNPDIVLLDLMLPGLDGLEVCRKLKSDPMTREIPIIMVTAKDEETEIVVGLEIGADDYVTKPFSPKELVARVKAVLRRGRLQDSIGSDERIARDGIVIDAARLEVIVDGERVVFTATEFRLLHYIASHPGRVFTREQLVNNVIGDDAIVIDRNIDVHIRAVRKKLGEHRDLIETIRGVGYRFRDV